MNKKNLSQVVRFGAVGGLNTAIDLVLFHVLANVLGINFIVANVFSTGTALIVSYFLHSRFTFGATSNTRSMASFVAVTLTGLWILQPLVIALTHPLFGSVFTEDMSLLAGKLVATIASLMWNFILYKTIVFKVEPKK